MSGYTAAEVAQFDQLLAVAKTNLAVFVASTRSVTERFGRIAAIHSMAEILDKQTDPSEVRSMLLAALDHLASDHPSSPLGGGR